MSIKFYYKNWLMVCLSVDFLGVKVKSDKNNNFNNVRLIVNSYTWGMAFRRRLTFKSICDTFLIVHSLRFKIFIPVKKTFTTYVLYRFSSKFCQTEKKFIFHWPFCEFRPKIEFKRLNKFRMTVKIPETFWLGLTGR